MRLLTATITAAVTAILMAATATAAVRIQAQDILLEPQEARSPAAHTARVLPPRAAPMRFNLVGLHWQGNGRVWVRVAPKTGGWSRWRRAAPEPEDSPDSGTPEARARTGWRLGNPLWTGEARRVQFRVAGQVKELRAFYVWSPPAPIARIAARASSPSIIPRTAWGADESIVRTKPLYADQLAFALIHHTAGVSPSTPEESAAVVRGIQVYHVKGNGWNDIGYNFLVDRFGQVFEGRAGGIDANVVGAHAEGFNTGSVGVAVIGSYSSASIAQRARSSLVRLLAWRLDVAHADPIAPLSWLSGGNSRFPLGAPVLLFGVSAHRDTGFTSCPGDAFYAELGEIAYEASALGLPKLYEPRVEGQLGGSARFSARLSEPLAWTVTVTDSSSAPVASGSGLSSEVDWTWDASGVQGGSYSYAIAAPGLRRAAGLLDRQATLGISRLKAEPLVLTPNADGVGDTTEISFSLTRPASVTVTLLDATGAALVTLAGPENYPAGASAVSWSGALADGSTTPDGRYRALVSATDQSGTVTRTLRLVVDRTLGSAALSSEAISPNRDDRLDTLGISFELTGPAVVRVRIMSGHRSVARIFLGEVSGGHTELTWNGRKRLGRVLDGLYTAVIEATTPLGTRKLERPFRVDTEPPTVELGDLWQRRGATKLLFALSEPARLKVWYDTAAFSFDRAQGESGFWQRLLPRTIRVLAWDAAGNRSGSIKLRLS